MSLMKIGDYVTTQEIADQSAHRWVLLTDFVYGEYSSVVGGTIALIADTKTEAWEKEIALGLVDTDTLLVCGALEPLSVGGVFVE